MYKKIAITAMAVSLLPIWKEPSTGKGLNFWKYIYSTAFMRRKHITPEEAIENYRKKMEFMERRGGLNIMNGGLGIEEALENYRRNMGLEEVIWSSKGEGLEEIIENWRRNMGYE
jgi:hypothetical protein